MTNWTTLEEVSKVVSKGTTPTTLGHAFVSSGIPFLRAEDVTGGAVNPRTFSFHISEETHNSLLRSQLQSGDLLITIAGTLGRIGYVPVNAGTMNCNQAVAFVRLNPELIDLRYACFACQSQIAELLKLQKIGTIGNLNLEQIRQFRIPLPTLAEQKRIAALLDKADHLRRSHRYAQQLSDSLLQSAFLEMFGDPLNNPRGWDTSAIETLLSTSRAGTQTGPFGSSLKRHEYVKIGIPVWGINNVRPNKFVEQESLFITPRKYNDLTSYSVEAGDILISRAGTVGRMCVARPTQHPSIIGTNLVRISLNSSLILPEYFVALFTYFPERIGRLRMSHDENAYSFLNPTILRTLEIPVPPIPAQERFVAVVDQQRRIQALHHEANRQAKHLFQTLLNHAFST